MENTFTANSRIVQLRQVMSSFALTCKPSAHQKLNSAENYAEWRHYVGRILLVTRADLKSYFLTGTFNEDGFSPEESMRLATVFETALQTVLQVTVSPTLIDRYNVWN
ncbi:unnamed protein product [[Candida] boidinii]|uniref:Unnamed protein product n=1 Tax=Candida boidinii TaxID=5477 RepID=A0A9W6T7B8_CANBO|nr:unnamed protein product [[Candida] boidinii]